MFDFDSIDFRVKEYKLMHELSQRVRKKIHHITLDAPVRGGTEERNENWKFRIGLEGEREKVFFSLRTTRGDRALPGDPGEEFVLIK